MYGEVIFAVMVGGRNGGGVYLYIRKLFRDHLAVCISCAVLICTLHNRNLIRFNARQLMLSFIVEYN